MLNYVWAFMILFSLVIALFTGRLEATSAAAITGAKEAVTLSIELLGIICFWNGLMNIANKSGMIEKISSFAKPIYKILFPRLSPSSKAGGSILLNLSANLLGLGNAATPLGIAAMGHLDEINGHSPLASNDMIMFVVLNTASFQLIPTTLISLRTTMGSHAPTEIIVPIWIASFLSVVIAVTYTKLLNSLQK